MIEMPEEIEARDGVCWGSTQKLALAGKMLSRVSMMPIEPVGGKITQRDLISALSRNGFGGVDLTLRIGRRNTGCIGIFSGDTLAPEHGVGIGELMSKGSKKKSWGVLLGRIALFGRGMLF